jgi:hypothetical protein
VRFFATSPTTTQKKHHKRPFGQIMVFLTASVASTG